VGEETRLGPRKKQCFLTWGKRVSRTILSEGGGILAQGKKRKSQKRGTVQHRRGGKTYGELKGGSALLWGRDYQPHSLGGEEILKKGNRWVSCDVSWNRRENLFITKGKA